MVEGRRSVKLVIATGWEFIDATVPFICHI